ncbi:MAG: topoisomerase IV, partial [Clostridia bacterium]|nr:topoisomerase IV [Clostridia bacterium]
TTIEQIIEKVVELVKLKKVTEINDIRDETDLKGLKITIDLKRGVDPDKLMKKLYKSTPLEDSFGCNFNVLIANSPRVMGVKELISEWVAFRNECVKRRVFYNLEKTKERLHLLKGLAKILLDIDKAIKIVRETDEEKEVVPNLMIGFGIDEVQAEYVAEIKLRHLNRQYILKRLEDVENLEKQVLELQAILDSKRNQLGIIIKELEAVAAKYGQPRKSVILETELEDSAPEEVFVDNSPVTVFYTKDGYFKKITPQSLRMSGEQKLKEGDVLIKTVETTNAAELLFFSDKHQVYKSKTAEFSDSKASVLGDYIPSKLDFEEGESSIYMTVLSEYKGYMIFAFENGRVAKVPISSYETKNNRKKLIKAYCDKFPIHTILYIKEECDLLIKSTNGRSMLVNTAMIPAKASKENGGIMVMTQKRGQRIFSAEIVDPTKSDRPHRYRARNLPAAGSFKQPDTETEQLTF